MRPRIWTERFVACDGSVHNLHMARRPINADFYDALVDAFRETPGNAHSAAKVARRDPRSGGSCNRRTALRAWKRGWPNRGLIPISETLKDEKRSARKAVEELDEDQLLEDIAHRTLTREERRQEAIDARAASYIVSHDPTEVGLY